MCNLYVGILPHLPFPRPLLTWALFLDLYISSWLNSNILFKDEILPQYGGGGPILQNSRRFFSYSLSYFCTRHLATSPHLNPAHEPHVEMLCPPSGVFTQHRLNVIPQHSAHSQSHHAVLPFSSVIINKQKQSELFAYHRDREGLIV